MMVNDNNKYCSSAEYFYNQYIDMYCIVGTAHSSEDLATLQGMFESPDLLREVPAPDYITEDYDGAEW